MYEKLDEIEKRYEELQQKMADPAVATDVAVFRDTMKAVSEIDDVVAKYRELKDIRKRLGDARELLKSDDDMRELAEMEIADRCSRPRSCACTSATPRRGGGKST